MTDQTAPLTWPNDVNTILARDPDGTAQNIAFLDSEWNLTLGAPDPRVQLYHWAPDNFWRESFKDDFHGSVLSSAWSQSGGGYTHAHSPSKIALNTGAVLYAGPELRMANYAASIGWDARLYFLLEVPTAGNLDLQFGFKNPATYERAMIRRYDASSAAVWQGYTQNAAGLATATGLGFGNDNVRRVACIHLAGDRVRYYAGDSGNNLTLCAEHTTSLPDANAPLVPFVSITNQGAQREAWIDVVALSANK